MTNESLSLAQVLDLLAERLSQSLTVTHFLNSGRDLAATNTLELRMAAQFDAYANGDLDKVAVFTYGEWALNTPGLLLHRAIREAAARRIEAMK